jgi:hypothetical protein
MIYAKPNTPVRLFVDLPDYATDKYVQAKIYYEGTSSGGSSLCATVNLSHNASIPGRYENLWTAIEGYDRLTVRYITYSDAAYSNIDYGYGATSDQIVLNAGGGGGASLGAYGGGVTVKPFDNIDLKKIKDELKLTDADVDRIAKRVKDKLGINEFKNYVEAGNQKILGLFTGLREILNGSLDRIRQLPEFLDERFNRQVKEVREVIANLSPKIEATEMVVRDSQNKIIANTEAEGLRVVKEIEQGIQSNAVLKDIEELKHKIRQSSFLLELTALFNSRFEDFVNKYKVPEAADFAFFLDSVSKESKNLTGEQSKYITKLLANKIDETVIGVNNQSTQKTVTILTDLLKRSGQSSEETAKIQKMVNELIDKTKNNEDRISKLAEDNMNGMKGVVQVIQNNVMALAKIIEKHEQGKGNQMDGINSEINRIKKSLDNIYD